MPTRTHVGSARHLNATTLAVTALLAAGARAEGNGPVPPDDDKVPIARPDDQTAALPSVEITGSAAASDRDIPQSIDRIDRKELTEQGVRTLQDALRNIPGLTLNAGEGGVHGDSVNLRGLSIPDSFFLDGVRDIGQYQRDTFNQESVAVLLGPSSVLFGRGSTAGVINSISKKPMLAPYADATFSVGNASLLRSTGDFNWVLDDATATAARITLMAEHSGVAERDEATNRRTGIAPTVSFGIGTATRLTVGLLHQEENNLPDYGIPFIDGKPAAVNRSNFYGLANYDKTRTDVNITTARFDHDFNDSVSVSNTLRAARYGFEYLLSLAHLDNDFTEPPPPGTPLSQIGVYRDQPSSAGAEKQLIDTTDLTTRFRTGALAHTLITGLELSRESSDVTRYVNGIDVIPPTPILSPDAFDTPPTPLAVDTLPRTRGSDVSVYATDSVAIDPRWTVDAGLRLDRFDSAFGESTSGSAFSRRDTEVSPRGAVIYKPSEEQSYYLSYSTSYNPAIEYLTLAPTSESLSPEKDRTLELGSKLRLLDGRLALTGALFETKLSNARIADPDDPTVQDAPFDQRVRGLELRASGHLTKAWELKAGYTHLDDRIVATSDPLALGKQAPNSPRDGVNLWSTYKLSPAWSVGGGGNYAGHRYADTDNTAGVPGYVLVNAMASYKVNDNVGLQVNLDNVTNKLYYNSLYYSAVDENHTVPGPGRTVILTANIHY